MSDLMQQLDDEEASICVQEALTIVCTLLDGDSTSRAAFLVDRRF